MNNVIFISNSDILIDIPQAVTTGDGNNSYKSRMTTDLI